MKKVILSMAGLLATAAFAPEVSALPVFARQTGMACQACHFQHFPLLNSFGRAFKASGFTMMGAQGKIEGDEHAPLSIPNTLNFGVLTTAGIEKQSGNPTGTQVDLPASTGELSLFYGGRVTENVGFISELGLIGPASTGSAKLVMMYPMGDAKVGVSFYTGAKGAAYSMELLNTGAVQTHTLAAMPGMGGQHWGAVSAAQYLGTQTDASGVHLIATTTNLFANLGRYALAPPGFIVGTDKNNNNVKAGTNGSMDFNYLRLAAMFDLAGFDSAVGIQNFSGGANDGLAGCTPTALGILNFNCNTKATIVDGQMQGELGGMPVGFYATYGRAPADALGANLFNTNTTVAGGADKRSFNIAGELGVIPHKATVQLGFRSGKNGTGTLNTAAGQGDTDNAVMIGGTYELAQNLELSLTYTTQSGNAWNACTAIAGNCTVIGAVPVGKNANSIKLEALF